MNIQEFREQYPDYDHVDDQTLAGALHKKHYSHVSRSEFDAKFLGVSHNQPQNPVQPEAQPQGGTIINPLAQGATLGFADEMAAGGAALYGKLSGDHPDKSLGEIYSGVRGQIQADTDAYSQRNPKTALAAELGGGLLTGGAVAKGVLGAGNVATKTGAAVRGGAVGAVEGGLYGAGTAQPGERLEGAAKGAAIGAPLGSIGGVVADKVGKTLADRAMKVRGIKSGSSDKSLAGFKLSESGRLQQDKSAQDAIRQGFSEALIQQVKTASPADQAKIRQMTRIAELSLKSNRFASTNRINKPIGQSLTKRVGLLNGKMRDAADQLDNVAKSLKPHQVDYRSPVEKFVSDLRDLDIKISTQGGVSVSTKGSMIEQATDAEGILRLIMNRLADTDAPKSAYDIHRVKRFIDNMVTYGKGQEKGLKGEVLRAVKGLRHNLDQVLDDAFPEYNRVNTQYADNRNALDTLQEAWGGKVDMFDPKQLGIQSRKLLSNYVAGTNQIDAIEAAEKVVRKYGGKLDDNIMELVSVESAMRSMMPQKMFNTFQGDIQKGVGGVSTTARLASGDPMAAAEVASGFFGKHKARKMAERYNPEQAIQSLKRLLSTQKPVNSSVNKGSRGTRSVSRSMKAL